MLRAGAGDDVERQRDPEGHRRSSCTVYFRKNSIRSMNYYRSVTTSQRHNMNVAAAVHERMDPSSSSGAQ
jgi:hypothetical protein